MSDLAHVLRHLPRYHDPRLLVGDNPADDAAVYRVQDDLALVQTVDFFTPIVDDPYVYGQIAAANALSDVYAMGGQPITALNIAGFPVKLLGLDILAEILRGGADKAHEAGVTIVGGHTVDDEEPKYGLSVTGTVDPSRMLTTRGALAGDTIVLTKPIGTGLIATATKAGVARDSHVAQSVHWMTTLNRSASIAARASRAHAVTDVTGFGLLGHLVDLCAASGVGAQLSSRSVPLLPGAWEYAVDGFTPGGATSNLAYVRGECRIDRDVDERVLDLLADPQTSGGLLVCLAPSSFDLFARSLASDAIACAIGSISPMRAGTTVLVTR